MDSYNQHNRTLEEEIQIGKYEVFFKKSYKILYTVNDILIGIWFLIGSLCFFKDSLQTIGVWLFTIGSAELLIRPTIKLIHDLHLKNHIKQQKGKA